LESSANGAVLSEQRLKDFGDTSGVRLDYLEVYNWGTFHERVARITPGGQTALLTGDNGSGKSTLADAVLTLLVPGTSRNYNAASGDVSRRERKEIDYVRGVIGTIYDERTQRDEVNALRKQGQYVTILLGVFKKFGTAKSVSIAQILWIKSNGELGKFHIAEERALTIEKDLLVTEPSTIRETLRDRVIEPIETFAKYSERFHRLLGLNADRNPMGIFNQTVAVKDIGNLTKFMRDHMLEDASALTQFDKLKERVRESRETHRMIKMLTEQLAMLETISSHVRTRRTALERAAVTRGMQAALEYYCDQLELGERRKTSLKNETDLASLGLKKIEADAAFIAANTLVTQLEQKRASNKAAASMAEIEREVKRLEDKSRGCSRLREQFQQKVFAVDANKRIETADGFARFIAELPRLLERAVADHERATQAFEKMTIQRAAKMEDGKRLENEQNSLVRRTTNIPEDFIAKRRVILDGLNLEAHQIPYVGELLKVKESEARWTGAIEHLGRSFALTMLVPQSLKEKVDAFVNEHRMRGRIQYEVLPALIPTSAPAPAGSACSKLEVKPNTGEFGKFLLSRLPRIFDHICCESTDGTWHRADRAITVKGLIKTSERRVKDDDRDINDRSNWVLGWSNTEKLAAVRAALEQVRNEFQQIANEYDASQKLRQGAERRREAIENLQASSFSFEEIDVVSVSIALEQQKVLLSTISSDVSLAALANQLKEAQEDQKQRRRDADNLVGKIAVLENDELANLQEIQRLAAPAEPPGFEQQRILLDELSNKLDAAGVTAKRMRAEASKQLWKEINDSEKLATGEAEKCLAKMGEVIKHENWQHLHEEIGQSVPTSITDELIDRFAGVEKRIKADDLPKTEEKFRCNLQENVIDELNRFKTSLDLRAEEIHKRIRDLNIQLERVNFDRREGQETYIRLKPDRMTDEQVKAFRTKLDASLSNILNIDADLAAREECYHMVNGLIEELDAKPVMRDRVIDVRNWFEFKAEECYRAKDGNGVRIKETYRGAMSKSGGEKSRLASTVLATAVAYQYGIEIDRPNAGTFRFVLIDEALARIGDSFSEYLFEVFGRFHLQLLIINPIDGKLHVAEQYAKRFHVVRKPDRFSSVANMSVSEFQEFRVAAESAS